MTLLVRGPSSSSRKMFCQVPLINLPSLTGRILDGPVKEDAKWASALSSTLSWSHPAPFGKSCCTFFTISFKRPASCSFTIMAVVEWTLWIMQSPFVTTLFFVISSTWRVMSMTSVLFLVDTEISSKNVFIVSPAHKIYMHLRMIKA